MNFAGKFFTSTKPERLFLIFAILFGLIFLLKTPVFQVPDEAMHLLRACETASGVFHNDKNGDYTKDFLPDRKIIVKQNFSVFSDFKDRKHYTNLFEFKNLNYTHNNSGYSFVMYIPSAIGIIIVKTITQNPYIIFYAARFFNLCCWIILTYFAIKITPFKWQYMICALFPMTIYEGASVSADSLNLGFAFMYTGFVFNLAYQKDNVSRKDIVLLTSLTLLTVFFKGLYILALIIFLIPKKKIKYKYLSFTLLLAIVYAIEIFTASNSYILTANSVDIIQREFMLKTQPLYVFKVFANTLLHKSSFYLQSAIFRLGWLEIKPNPVPVLLLFTAYLCCSFVDKIKLRAQDKLFVLIINGTFILLTILFYFLTFSPLDNNLIIGVQGRYFIPLFLTFAVVTQNSFKLNTDKIKLFTVVIILFNLIYAVCLI